MNWSEKKTLSSRPTRSAASRNPVVPSITSAILSFKICVYSSCFEYSHS